MRLGFTYAKGATVGLITMGHLGRILLARLVGGSLADALGWRGMLYLRHRYGLHGVTGHQVFARC